MSCHDQKVELLGTVMRIVRKGLKDCGIETMVNDKDDAQIVKLSPS